ncbi:alpha-1-antitrypsin-like protein CM55-SI isoform X1 [Manis pentadactyla]|uniref:alpha-1-antitrypsin-like protein CM55-SI isoform X1 n=2 Tax=Manis pentadactyla TaxID=143292 RepID=UPI00255C4386|nr:alpha-1-antitrypsin-like protein CM55-SI isoform X1 [Manis pentadactyla]
MSLSGREDSSCGLTWAWCPFPLLQDMPFSIAWGLLLLADLCYRVPGSMHVSEHSHEIRKNPPNPSTAPKLANFSFKFYQSLAGQSNTSNIVLSPVSIAIAFAMPSLGTKGDTHTQILHGLDVNFKKVPKADDVHKAFHHLLNTLNRSDSQFQLATKSAVFIDKNLKHVHNFLKTVKNTYHTEAFPINFEDTEEAKKQINDYAEKGTQGKIVDLVQELDKDTVLVLVNYIFFKDSWKDKFEAKHFGEGDFHVEEKTAIRVPMATCLGVFGLHWDRGLSCWVLLRHFEGRARAFLLMPDPGKMPQLEESLSEEYLSNILRDVDIWYVLAQGRPSSCHIRPARGWEVGPRPTGHTTMHDQVDPDRGRGRVRHRQPGSVRRAVPTGEETQSCPWGRPSPAQTLPLPDGQSPEQGEQCQHLLGESQEGRGELPGKGAAECGLQDGKSKASPGAEAAWGGPGERAQGGTSQHMLKHGPCSSAPDMQGLIGVPAMT